MCLELNSCEICGGQLMFLGKLGNRIHLTCRDCGMQFSRTVDEDDFLLHARSMKNECFLDNDRNPAYNGPDGIFAGYGEE